ncbi:hypothetical protein Hanom_Chr01g00048621 [Helianthus anomalus]
MNSHQHYVDVFFQNSHVFQVTRMDVRVVLLMLVDVACLSLNKVVTFKTIW